MERLVKFEKVAKRHIENKEASDAFLNYCNKLPYSEISTRMVKILLDNFKYSHPEWAKYVS